jgi:hypothetical protein
LKVVFVSKRLAFGSTIKTQVHAERLGALGITHIINLRWSQNNARVRQLPHTWLRLHDDKKSRPRWFYRRALKFYNRAMKDPRTTIFVMRHHGICRSASVGFILV